ncbi:GTPase-associated system all-helical protein GASH [Sphingomonas sp.]|uniref:GTPase-associated system all-helical protein GASH n=1 Tax=Sphingomonas sp. TaxID=28214 RepID=UPI003B3B3C43
MAEKTIAMDANFARWYSQEFMDDGTVREARWKAVVAMAADANYWRVEVLVRLAFAAKDPGGHKNEKLASAYETVVGALRSGGQEFDPAKSARELQVLAAAALVRLFASSADAALAVTTASFCGLREPALPMQLPTLAARALADLTARHHARPDIASLKIEAPAIDYDPEAEVAEGETELTTEEQVNALRDAADEALVTIANNQNAVTQALVRRTLLAEEELQMLWWLVGGYSVTRDRPFTKIAAAAQPFILANELGEMTNASPGPASIKALLAKAGVGSKAVPVRDAVNAVDLDWAKRVSNSLAVSPLTTPLHFALEKRAEVENDTAWQAGWAALTGLAVNVSLPADQLAELFYREHLFLRVSS